MAILTVGLIERVDAIGFGPLADVRFTPDQVEEVRYAALLHDFGKVAVQEKFLRKGKKLYASQMIAIRQRFAYILKAIEADHLRARLAALDAGRSGSVLAEIEAEYLRRKGDAERVLQAVLKANEPTVVEEESFRALMNLPARTLPELRRPGEFPVEEWAAGPFLSTDEVEALSIRKGSLSETERREIESHVSHTYELPAAAPVDRRPAQHPRDRLGAPREAGRHRATRAASRPADIQAAVADDDDRRHLRRARGLGPALQDARCPRSGRGRSCARRRAAGKLDQELLHVFLETEVFRLPAFKELLQKKA